MVYHGWHHTQSVCVCLFVCVCVCWCTNANHYWSYVGNGQSPSCEVTNHAVTLVLNVNHHWWIGSGTREASWQISHLNCTFMTLYMRIDIGFLTQKAMCTHTHTATLWYTCKDWTGLMVIILYVAVTNTNVHLHSDVDNVLTQTAPTISARHFRDIYTTHRTQNTKAGLSPSFKFEILIRSIEIRQTITWNNEFKVCTVKISHTLEKVGCVIGLSFSVMCALSRHSSVM